MRPRRRRRSSDFCHDDTIVSTTLSKGRFLADSGRPCRRMVQTHDDESSQAPGEFHHPGERRAGLPSLRFPTSVLLRAGGRASRAVDDFPRPCGRLPSPARAESPESRTSVLPKKDREASPYSTASRAPLGHRFCSWEFGERSRATNQPKTRPTFRVPRRTRTMRPHRDAFGRPSLVRAREDYSSACSSGTRETFLLLRRRVAVPGSRRLCYHSLRSVLWPWQVALPGSEARRSRGREEIDADLSMGGVVEWLGGGVLRGPCGSRWFPSRAAASGTTSTTEHFRG
jgi:hypothetical protein